MTMLCSICKKLPALVDFDQFAPHHTAKSLQASAKTCPLCKLIWSLLVQYRPFQDLVAGKKEQKPDKTRLLLYYGPFKALKKVDSKGLQKIWVSVGEPEIAGANIELFNQRDEKGGPDIIVGRSVDGSFASQSTFDVVSDALKTCFRNHASCSSNSTVPLPRFTIDVLPGKGTDAYLLENNGKVQVRSPYVTLSYCWGGPQPIQLTTKTLDTFKKSIPFAELPATLKDAIVVTRKLGYRYLWVDALCIIQDDDVEKQKELAIMAQIYNHSVLTVQAAFPTEVTQGFLDRRAAPVAAPVKLLFQKGHGKGGKDSYVYARRGFETGATSTGSRAWIFQETVLPPRLLVYSKHQLFLSCREALFSEDGTGGGPRTISPSTYKNIRPDLFPGPRSSPTTWRQEAVKQWYSSVSLHFSPRFQTVSGDRLNAIWAYAEEAHKVIGGRYLAGLWDVDLTRGFLWHSIHKPLSPATSYRAPSWSWASYDGQIVWPTEAHYAKLDKDPRYRARILDATTRTVGGSPFAECHDGRVTLEAHVGMAFTEPAQRPGKTQVPLRVSEKGHEFGTGKFDCAEKMSKMVFCVLVTSHAGLMLSGPGTLMAPKLELQRVGWFTLPYVFDKEVSQWVGSCKRRSVSVV